MQWYLHKSVTTCPSLIPRPSHCPVFDRLRKLRGKCHLGSHALLRRELGARAKRMKSMSTKGRGKGPRDLRSLLVAKRWSSEHSQSMSLAVHLLFRTENFIRRSIVVLRVSVFHCSLASQTHFCNKREGSGELCIHKPYQLHCTVWFNHAALLWHMTHCNVSVEITVWTIMTKTQDIIFTTAGAVADLRGVKGGANAPPFGG